VDITSNAFYKCTATFRTQICRKCLWIKLNELRPVQTLVDITSNTFYKCTATFRTYCIILYYYYVMGPPSYMRSVVDRNVVMRRIPAPTCLMPPPITWVMFHKQYKWRNYTTRLLLQGIGSFHVTEPLYCIILLMTTTMEAEFSPEMLITTYQSTPCHDTGDSTNIDSCIYRILSVLLCTWPGWFYCTTDRCPVR
jgi:hypothetical protein